MLSAIRNFATGAKKLKPATTVVKNLPVDLEKLRDSNRPLYDFYMTVLAEDTLANAPDEVLRVALNQTVERLENPQQESLFKWQLSVTAVRAARDAATGDVVDGSEACGDDLIRSVTFDLHPTFTPASVTCDARDDLAGGEEAKRFSITRVGWGTFAVGVTLLLANGETKRFTHDLDFAPGGVSAHYEIALGKAKQPGGAAELAQDRRGRLQAKAGGNGSNGGKGGKSASNDGGAAGKNSMPTAASEGESKAEGKEDGGLVGGVGGVGGVSAAVATGMKALPRMTGVPAAEMHGFRGDDTWGAPLVTNHCTKEARPGYNTRDASEFNEEPAVLRAKVKVLASLIRDSKNMVAYTGAGISTGAGIGDYATKAANSAAKKGQPKLHSNLDAQPTLAHCVLTALGREDHLKHWVQQNHDGLPQKAGYPQEKLNEIHGAWHDPSNPVVPMTGSLRGDLCQWMYDWETKADLCLAMGTSLCGMNADRMVSTPAEKAAKGEGLGSVIVGIQRTAYDHLASLRIFAKIDEVMALLAWEMQLSDVPPAGRSVPTVIPPESIVGPHQFRVPYHVNGSGKKLRGVDGLLGPRRTAPAVHAVWDLRPGARIILPAGPGKGFEGIMRGVGPDGHYRVELPNVREGDPMHGKGRCVFLIGSWWVEAATKGLVSQLPVVNATQGN